MELDQNKKCFRVLTASEQEERAKIIRSGARLTAQTDDYGQFSHMTPETARRLISEGYADPKDSQNGAPTFEEMTAFCEAHPGFTLEGYVIGGDRADARVTADTVKGQAADMDTLRAFTELFKRADDFWCSEISYECYCWFD